MQQGSTRAEEGVKGGAPSPTLAGVATEDDGAPGLWAPLRPEEVGPLLSTYGGRWWIAGGLALELHVGRSWRSHEDIDVGIVRGEAPTIVPALAGAGIEAFVAASGHLRPWDGRTLDEERHENNVWCREPGGPWLLDLQIGSGDEDGWIYSRDPSIRAPWVTAVLRSNGVPYLAPEIQMLFKSTHLRERDDSDAREVIPALDPEARARLQEWLPEGHPWHRLMG